MSFPIRPRTVPATLVALLATLAGCSLELSRDLEAGEVRGRAVSLGADGTTAGLVDAVVRIEGTPITVKTDAKGRFRVRGLPPGRYGLRIDAPAAELAVRVRGLSLETALDLGDVVLGRLGALEGDVVLDGDEVRGTVVLGGSRQVAITAGHVRAEGLPPGEFQVVVLAEGAGLFDLGTITVTAGSTTTLTFDLSGKAPLESFGLSGTALLSGETDHSGITVHAVESATGGASTSKDGLYADALVTTGIYTLVARKAGYRDQVVPNVVVGGDLDVPTIVLLKTETTCEAGGLAVSADDKDADGTPDASEDAACVCTPGTRDLDEDGLCEDTDPDLDGDGVLNGTDNCPVDWNEDQADADADSLGDVCDPLCGEANIDCATLDTACERGFCDPNRQACNTIPLDGNSCDDGDLCTTGDRCAEGGCTGEAVDCGELSGACGDGVCDGETGLCGFVAAPDDTGCSDGDACTSGDTCAGGTCIGSVVDCSGAADACNTATCDPESGSCVPVPRAGEISCDDGDACTEFDACSDGECTGAAHDCSASATVCRAAFCSADGSSAVCLTTPLNDGTTCSQANPCIYGTTCTSGECGIAGDCVPQSVKATPAGFVQSPGSGSGAFEDLCGTGRFMVGIEGLVADGASQGALVGLSAVCADVYVYNEVGWILDVSVSGSVPVEGLRGSAQGVTPFSVTCGGPNGVVTGIGVDKDAGGSVTNVRLDCASAAYADDRVTGPHVGLTPTTPVAVTVTSLTANAFTASCPAGTVAVGQRGEADTTVTSYGVSCATPVFEFQHETPHYAGIGGGPSIQDCRSDEALIGFDAKVAGGFYNGTLTSFSARCAPARAGTATADGWTLVPTGTGSRLPVQGVLGTWSVTDNVARSTTCPAGTLMVGATVVSNGSVKQITPRCANVEVVDVAGYGPRLRLTNVTPAATIGTASGPTVRTWDCPVDTVVVGMEPYAGEILDGIRLRCALPSAPSA